MIVQAISRHHGERGSSPNVHCGSPLQRSAVHPLDL